VNFFKFFIRGPYIFLTCHGKTAEGN